MTKYSIYYYFFFNDTATTEIYTLSLHDALPISLNGIARGPESRRIQKFQGHDPNTPGNSNHACTIVPNRANRAGHMRSEEHTSELQSQSNLVCRLLLEKKKHYT